MKNISNHYDNGTIEYTMNRTFHFEQFGNFSEDDIITTINFVYVVSICNYREISRWGKTLLTFNLCYKS